MSQKSQTGFVVRLGLNRFRVDWRKVPSESYFATARLLREIILAREFCSGVMLDVGCSTKPYKCLFEDRATSHIGIDVPFSFHSLEQVDAFSTAVALPFKDASFDSVLCTEVLEHVSDPLAALREISRVLKPGCHAIVTTPFMYRLHEVPYDFFRYTPYAYRSMASACGLEVIKISPRGGYFSVVMDLLIKGLAQSVSAIGIGFHKLTGIGRGVLQSVEMRAAFSSFQRPLATLLAKENVKSDVYTLGYVAVLRRSGTPLQTPAHRT